jgi:L-asparaginase
MPTNKQILVINTGGTFNKRYDPLKGALYVDNASIALEELAFKWKYKLEIINIIGKDSLDFSSHDRLELLAIISQSEFNDIIIIHGTDTMSFSAEYLADADLEKRIVLTGAMVPYAIDPVEATANFSSAMGYLKCLKENGVYIVMNGIFDSYEKVEKDKRNSKFVSKV